MTPLLLAAGEVCDQNATDWPTAVVLVALFAAMAIVGWAIFR